MTGGRSYTQTAHAPLCCHDTSGTAFSGNPGSSVGVQHEDASCGCQTVVRFSILKCTEFNAEVYRSIQQYTEVYKKHKSV